LSRALLDDAGKLSPADRQVLIAAVRRAIDLYDSWNRPEDAAAWRRHLIVLKRLDGGRRQ
jgi:hypothetical protein